MPYLTTWEEFSKAAEKLYITNPNNVSIVPRKLWNSEPDVSDNRCMCRVQYGTGTCLGLG